ncbi:tetratricopeptide repeat protein [Streptomyces agglomeratus]|uniref:tetratricopeptide repeat protein n=1 Tax=Streptomyces agglomeratus TaxID=285458 RepID=UPI0023E44993|nr:tetratricopeptide repeat protein [Streptomyces agglomeratus]
MVTHPPSPRGAVPNALSSLPPSSPGFVGRTAELQTLLRVLKPDAAGHGVVTAAAVTGLGGAGKTALALQAAREAQSLGWFPGGVLFVDLHGHDDAPVAPEKALEALLRALGTAPEYIPPTADERAGLYQSMLAEIAAERGPVLIVADNAAQASQARPLLPALSVHRMLVTSRETLAQLDAHQLHLGVLAPAIAWEVLEKALEIADPRDPRLEAEPDEGENLCRLCGYLPLALQIAAAVLIVNPGKSVAELTSELADTTTRMDYLDDGERGMKAAFDLSYRRLTKQQARLFRMVALAPGADVSHETLTVSHGAALPPRGVDALVRAHLVEPQDTRGHWRMHDLLRAYVVAKVAADDQLKSDHDNARTRLLSRFSALAAEARAHLRSLPVREPRGSFSGREAALEWLDGERTSLVSATTWAIEPSHARASVRLALHLGEYLGLRRFYDDALVVYRHAIEGARSMGDLRSEGRSWNNLGIALRRTRKLDDAVEAFSRALAAYERVDAGQSAGRAWNNLGRTLVELRRFDEAVEAYKQVGRLSESHAHPLTVAIADNGLGRALTKSGRLDEAMDSLVRAREASRRWGNRYLEGTVINNIGRVRRRTGSLAEALADHDRARAIFVDIGEREGTATSHNERALVLAAMGRFATAVEEHGLALQIFREIGEQHRQAVVANDLGLTLQRMGRHGDAEAKHILALEISQRLGDQYHVDRSLSLLAVARAGAAAGSRRTGRRWV